MDKRTGKWPHIPLEEHLKGDTHIRIVCRCRHEVTMLTSELYRLLPRATMCSEFHAKMKCTRCGLRGWVNISAAGR